MGIENCKKIALNSEWKIQHVITSEEKVKANEVLINEQTFNNGQRKF